MVENFGQQLELADDAGAVACPEQVPHHTNVPVFVGRVEGDELVEPSGSTEQFAESQLQALAVVKRPVLVGIQRQQITRVDGQRTVDGAEVVARQSLRGQALEGEGVDV